jgi:hypothetical protein
MPRATLWLLTLLGCAACSGNVGLLPAQPTGITPAVVSPSSPDAAVQAGASGCYTVKFNVAASPLAPGVWEGVLTGDVQGTVHVQFDLTSVEFAGVTVSNSGTAHWVITGGTVPPITFDTTFDNRNLRVDRPGSPATLTENIGTHRASGGVAKANLTYHGTFTTVPTRVTDHDYLGVICLE